MDDGDSERSRMLREFLGRVDEPCPECGYSLRGLTGESCPECGESLVLRVGMADPAMGAFLWGLLGLAFGVGFHGLVLLWAVTMLVGGRGGPGFGDLLRLLLGLGLCGVGLVAWVRSRRRVRRSALRGWLVAGAWTLSGSTALLFMLLVR